MKQIEIYLVGGSIRDKILNFHTKEKDWVITGIQKIDLLKLNFINVGKSFPVFLHPKTKEEYALSRKEEKIKKGYLGFSCEYKNYVTLKEDLKRRDLTINSIAESHTGFIIDPYYGMKDLSNKVLKHVSLSFIEDPLRVLRVARFLAKFHHLGFKLDGQLFILMRKVVKLKEMNYLSDDRIMKETNKALLCKNPEIFFKLLYSLDILKFVLPVLYKVFLVNRRSKIMNPQF